MLLLCSFRDIHIYKYIGISYSFESVRNSPFIKIEWSLPTDQWSKFRPLDPVTKFVLAHGLCIMFVVIRWWWKARWRPVKVTVNSNRGTVSSLCVHVCVCVYCNAVLCEWMRAGYFNTGAKMKQYYFNT